MVVQSALDLQPLVGDERALKIIAPVFNWKEEDISDILKQRDKRRMSDIQLLNGSAREFDELTGATNGRPDTSSIGDGQRQREDAQGDGGRDRRRGQVRVS
jgi:hypothetical protein